MFNSEKSFFIDVALGLPLEGPFTYKLISSREPKGLIGCRVLIPFKNKTMVGYITGIRTELSKEELSAGYKIRAAKEIIDTVPPLKQDILRLSKRLSSYYLCSHGEAIENAMPAYLRKKKVPFQEIKTRRTSNDGLREAQIENSVKTHFFIDDDQLNLKQREAVAEVQSLIDARKFSSVLLHGITGSGKTEVYIRSIRRALENDLGAICLFPEIALTQHLQSYFEAHFPDEIIVVHSRMSNRDRFIAWRKVYNGEKKVVLGPRSAVFMPLEKAGLIIIDEEHENTYKQNDVPRYHAVRVAQERMRICNGVVIMGGATPSLETRFAAESNHHKYISLPNRISGRPLPEVFIVDMKSEIRKGAISIFSTALKQAVDDTIEKKGGVLLFLNRRGFSTYVTCHKCGKYVECPDCDISMTYHQSVKKMICHYCDKTITPPDTCPSCGHTKLYFGGTGTQRIESIAARLFPEAVIERMDTDNVKEAGKQEKILDDFKNRKIDILIGTQMITKGFNFPHVTLVGILNADTMLALPDFRSGERTFQLLTQVAGRAGRGDEKGKVYIQSFSPDNYAIRAASKHGYEEFYKDELERRRELMYPPFGNIINVMIRSKNEQRAFDISKKVSMVLSSSLNGQKVECFGPAPLPFYFLRGYYRRHIMIRGRINQKVLEAVRLVKQEFGGKRDYMVAVDVDPVNIL